MDALTVRNTREKIAGIFFVVDGFLAGNVPRGTITPLYTPACSMVGCSTGNNQTWLRV